MVDKCHQTYDDSLGSTELCKPMYEERRYTMKNTQHLCRELESKTWYTVIKEAIEVTLKMAGLISVDFDKNLQRTDLVRRPEFIEKRIKQLIISSFLCVQVCEVTFVLPTLRACEPLETGPLSMQEVGKGRGNRSIADSCTSKAKNAWHLQQNYLYVSDGNAWEGSL